MLATKLKKGDTIGVVCPSIGLINDDLENNKFEMKSSEKYFNSLGYKVKYGKNIFSNTTSYGASAKEKAEDINEMYRDKNVRAIFSFCGGENSNSVFEYLDLDLIRRNNKIVCGYSDATSYINYICAKTRNIGFIGPAFKTISPEKADDDYSRDLAYCRRNLFSHITENSFSLSESDDEFKVIKPGESYGKLIGGNLSLITLNADFLDFNKKILFLEDLAYESPVEVISSRLYKLKQIGVFNKVSGIWLGNYEGTVSIEKILMDTIGDMNINYPIIKSDNFGHGKRIMTIPIGVNAKIKNGKIELTECYLED